MSNPAPSPVSAIASAGAAMREVDQDLNPFFDNVVRLLAFDIGHETNTACIVFLIGMVEALRFRKPGDNSTAGDLGWTHFVALFFGLKGEYRPLARTPGTLRTG